jgi:hypothetical protein
MAHKQNKKCTIEGCDKPHFGRGWCRKHYARWERLGTTEIKKRFLDHTEVERECGVCKVTKPIENFYTSTSENTYSGTCKVCVGIKQRLRKHSLTQEQMDELIVEANGKCQSCNEDITDKFIVDHDHSCCELIPSIKNGWVYSCGKCVRGLLCNQCNIIAGYIEKHPNKVNSVVGYLNKFKESND